MLNTERRISKAATVESNGPGRGVAERARPHASELMARDEDAQTALAAGAVQARAMRRNEYLSATCIEGKYCSGGPGLPN